MKKEDEDGEDEERIQKMDIGPTRYMSQIRYMHT